MANCGSSERLSGSQRRRSAALTALGKGAVFSAVLLCSVIVCSIAGCSDATDHSDCGSIFGGDTTLVNWWRPGDSAESAAQARLVDGYMKCTGGTVTIESTGGDKEDALIASEVSEKGLLLVNGRSDIDRLECTSTRNSGLFALHDLAGTRWRDRIPHFMWPYVAPCGGASNGRLFAVPVGLHTLNQIIVSPQYAKRLAAVGRDARELLHELQNLAAEGLTKPVAVPRSIQPSFLLVENLMVAVIGERYEQFWNMNRDTESPDDIDMGPFEATLDYADEFLRHVEFVTVPGGADETNEVMARLCRGEAALTVQADWVNPDDFCPGLVAMPFPGSAAYDVFSFDAFAVDKSTAKADPAAPAYLAPGSTEYAWLKAVSSREIQEVYASEKHSRVLVGSDARGNTVALAREELFGADVTPLPGLLLMVKHSYFVDFAEKIERYFFPESEGNDPASETPSAESRSSARSALRDYVHRELCRATTCTRTDIR